MADYKMNTLEQGAEELGITLSEKQKQQFCRYYELLVEWNSFMNLTAITEFEDVLVRHFLDSISLIKAVNLNEKKTVLDIGTGAGFPGIPLKIAFPELSVCLVDSLNKRVKFLNTVIEELGLCDIEAVHARAEDFAKQPGRREAFDLAVSRAVANLSSLSEYCLPMVKVGGMFASYKSGTIAEELDQAKKAISVLGGSIENTVYFKLGNTDMERSFVCIRKIKNTPKKYPRKAGLPSKEPIS